MPRPLFVPFARLPRCDDEGGVRIALAPLDFADSIAPSTIHDPGALHGIL